METIGSVVLGKPEVYCQKSPDSLNHPETLDAQRARYPLVKECSLNYKGLLLWIKVSTILKGSWAL